MRAPHLPSLPELQAFLMAAETGATTRAATALGLTQSAVSRSLASLEARLGVALFHRQRQRLILSDSGRAFLPDARALLVGLDQAAMKVMAFGGHAGVLRLAALPSFGAVWLVPRLAQFSRAVPGVTFDLAARLRLPDFDAEPLDGALLRLGPGGARPGLRQAELCVERLVVVAAPGLLADLPAAAADDWPAALGLEAALAQADLPLLHQTTRPELWRDWFRAGGLALAPARRGARFEQFAMILSAARAGLGLALVPEILVAEDLALGRLRQLSPRPLIGPAPYALIWPDRAEERPAFRAFRDWLLAAVASQPSP